MFQVLQNISLSMMTHELKSLVKDKLKTMPGVVPSFRKYSFDTMKIETQAHGFKTNDPVINKSDDHLLMLADDLSLADNGIKNETEISFFKKDDYEEYKKNPQSAW